MLFEPFRTSVYRAADAVCACSCGTDKLNAVPRLARGCPQEPPVGPRSFETPLKDRTASVPEGSTRKEAHMSDTTNGQPWTPGGFAYCEIAVGNADHAADWFRDRYGFQLRENGPEDWNKTPGERSHVLGQGGVTLAVTGALRPESPVADFVRAHGDGVRDVGLAVDDPEDAFHRAVQRGASPGAAPLSIDVLGAYTYTFVAEADGPVQSGGPSSLSSIDHLACALEYGDLDRWADFHVDVLGFDILMKETTDTGRSSMHSIVVRDPRSGATLTFVSPGAPGDRSQISEFLEHNGGPGVQHVAFASDDICQAVDRFTDSGAEFLRAPAAYYEVLDQRVPALSGEIGRLRDRSILADQDESGELLQIFTRPVSGRPTLFFEVIERRGGSKGFGAGNIKALFQAVEAEQLRRGTL